MALSVSNIGNQTFRLSKFLKNNLNYLNVSFFIMTAKIIDFPYFTFLKNSKDTVAVVFDIQLVPDIKAFSVYRKRLVMGSVVDHQGNKLLRKLIRTIVVGTT